MYRIRFHGRGGQGMKTASRILGTALFLEGYEVQDAPRYGAERRGAPIFAYVRADKRPILERGVITRPNLVVVADDTLLGVPAAGIMQGVDAHTILLIAGGDEAALWRDRLATEATIVMVPGPVGETAAGRPHVGVASAAAARLLGVVGRHRLIEAVDEELAGLGKEALAENKVQALDAFVSAGALSGVVEEGPEFPARPGDADWIQLPADPADVSAPAIHAERTSVQVRTGLWRTLRPIVDTERCRKCVWVCGSLCPDGVIFPDVEGHAAIDFDHCKGCLVCLAQCPWHAIEAVSAGARGPRSRGPSPGRERSSVMTRKLLTGNGAAAWGARLAGAEYMPVFPITPQTEIIETLGEWIDRGEMAARMVTLESEHSMVTAAGSAAATGVRTFTTTSSQGLLYAIEMLFTVSGWRAPFVLVNVSRGVATPVTLEPDHNDVLAARDSGFLQIHCATCQEIVDAILIAYRLAEDAAVRLPVIVNLDGFYLSFTHEPVDLPDTEAAARFLPPFDAGTLAFRAGHPVSEAVAVLGGGPYSYFRYQIHLAAEAALDVFDQTAGVFEATFGRRYEAVERYRMDDADVAFLMIGSFATKAKAAVGRLRAAGHKVGLVRPRLLRPFPEAALRAALKGVKGVAVVDQNLSMGKGGILFAEVASALYGLDGAPVLVSFIGGLGGRDIDADDFAEMAAVTQKAADTGEAPPPRLLFDADELAEVRKLQTLAAVEWPKESEPEPEPKSEEAAS